MNSIPNGYLVNFGSGFGSGTTGFGSVPDTRFLCELYKYLQNKIIIYQFFIYLFFFLKKLIEIVYILVICIKYNEVELV